MSPRASRYKRPKTFRESDQLGAMLDRMLRAMARRAGTGDVIALAELRRLQGTLDEAIASAGRAAHDEAGLSWTEIANELGISRQAARQRFGAK